MKKSLALLILVIGLPFIGKAQFNYDIQIQNQPYTPLSGGTSINGGTVWYENAFRVPLGFTFDMNGIPISNLGFIAALFIGGDTTSPFNGFSIAGANLFDLAMTTGGPSVSPIRYTVTGTAPYRIFKAEVYNAGFYSEYEIYHTSNDFVSFQVWLYETNNIFEIHYGNSNISHASLYFLAGGSPLVGYIQNLDLYTGSITKLYQLKGDPLNPALDSTTSLANLAGGLNSFPTSGTVYRFMPKTPSVNDVNDIEPLSQVKVYPTVCAASITIENPEHKTVRYRLSAMNGKSVMTGEIVQGTNKIDISELAQGLYYISFYDGKTSRVVEISKL